MFESGYTNLPIPSNCGTRPVAIPHGLAGSTGRDFDGGFWQSIINTKIYKSRNEKSRLVDGGCFWIIWASSKAFAWSKFDFLITFVYSFIYKYKLAL